MVTTAWGCCQVTGVVAAQTREFGAARTESLEVPLLVGAISQIPPRMVSRYKAIQTGVNAGSGPLIQHGDVRYDQKCGYF